MIHITADLKPSSSWAVKKLRLRSILRWIANVPYFNSRKQGFALRDQFHARELSECWTQGKEQNQNDSFHP